LLLTKKETSSVGVHRVDKYVGGFTSPNLVNVHFAARYYTWVIFN